MQALDEQAQSLRLSVTSFGQDGVENSTDVQQQVQNSGSQSRYNQARVRQPSRIGSPRARNTHQDDGWEEF